MVERRLGVEVLVKTKEKSLKDRCLYRMQCEGIWENIPSRARWLLTKFREIQEKREISLGVVVIPVADQVYGFEPRRTIFHQILKENGIPYLDLLDSFRRDGRTREILFQSDGHWTARGNELAATTLARWLQAHR